MFDDDAVSDDDEYLPPGPSDSDDTEDIITTEPPLVSSETISLDCPPSSLFNLGPSGSSSTVQTYEPMSIDHSPSSPFLLEPGESSLSAESPHPMSLDHDAPSVATLEPLAQASNSSVERPDNNATTASKSEESSTSNLVTVIASASGPRPRKIAKKGEADKSKWKRNIKLLKRMNGEGRLMKPVNCKCCSSKFAEDEREQMFSSFWKVSWIRKRDFLIAHVRKTETKRHTVTESRRSSSFKYMLPKQGSDNNIVVCKTFFLRTLAVGSKMIKGTLARAEMRASMVAIADGREGKSPANRTPAGDIENVKTFLKKLPTMPSHYCRKDTCRLYLEAGWTNRKLYDVYKSELQSGKIVSQKIFNQIVKDMNLSVFSPRKDQCDLCLGHKNGLIADPVWQEHIEQKDCSREAKVLDKSASLNNPKLLVATLDLQAVLLCPKSMSSATYYKRKLAVHNFTIYNVATKDTVCYLWHEGEGGLESHEFATMVIDYLESLPSEVEEVILWSDGCTYQNRNSILSSAIYQFITSNQKSNLREVHQKYLTRGHTQMECDSVHAAIEARARNIDIYTPMEWETVFKTARAAHPYKVIPVSHTFWKSYFPSISSIRPGKRTGDPVVTDLRHILYSREGDVLYSLSHGTPLRPLGCRIKSRGYATPRQKYDGPISVANKLPDLLELCRMIVPIEHQPFYASLV